MDALVSGAIAAGLSGTGPAVAAVVPQGRVSSVKAGWEAHGGQIIETGVNSERAHVLP